MIAGLSYKYPDLWRDCLGAWCPSRQSPYGLILYDQANRCTPGISDGIFNGMTASSWVYHNNDAALLVASNRVVINDQPNFTAPPLTMTAWVSLTTKNNYDGIFCAENFHGSILLSSVSGNPLGYIYEGTVDEYTPASGLTMLTDGTWQFVGLVITSTEATLYNTDGYGFLQSWVNTKTHNSYSTFTGSPGTPAYRLGDDRGLNQMDGYIDDCRVYNRALSVEEIRCLSQRRGIAYEFDYSFIPMRPPVASTGRLLRLRRELVG